MIYKDYCSRCKATNVPLLKYSKTTSTQYYLCRPCNHLKFKKFSSTAHGKMIVANNQRRTNQKNPEKLAARKEVKLLCW